MSVNDMIKKSVLKSFGQYNVPKMALALLVALPALATLAAFAGIAAPAASRAARISLVMDGLIRSLSLARFSRATKNRRTADRHTRSHNH